jgi:hypothetical protein
VDANRQWLSEIAGPAAQVPRSSSPFRLTPPVPLKFAAAPGDDVSWETAHRATSMKRYTVRAELEQTVTAVGQVELAGLLAGQQATISPNNDGGTEIQVAVLGHDIWQAILAAMVALTNANWTPIVLHIAHADVPERPEGTERP